MPSKILPIGTRVRHGKSEGVITEISIRLTEHFGQAWYTILLDSPIETFDGYDRWYETKTVQLDYRQVREVREA